MKVKKVALFSERRGMEKSWLVKSHWFERKKRYTKIAFVARTEKQNT